MLAASRSPQPAQQELALEGAGHLEVLLQGGHKAGHIEIVRFCHNVLQERARVVKVVGEGMKVGIDGRGLAVANFRS